MPGDKEALFQFQQCGEQKHACQCHKQSTPAHFEQCNEAKNAVGDQMAQVENGASCRFQIGYPFTGLISPCESGPDRLESHCK